MAALASRVPALQREPETQVVFLYRVGIVRLATAVHLKFAPGALLLVQRAQYHFLWVAASQVTVDLLVCQPATPRPEWVAQ